MAAVTQNGAALQHVPSALRTPEICEAAFEQNSIASMYFPDGIADAGLRPRAERIAN
jgi:hypothetical protein